MNDILKQRLVGALILVALGVVFWPIIFVEPGKSPEAEQNRIPPAPAVDTAPIEPPDTAGLRAPQEARVQEEARAAELPWPVPVEEESVSTEQASTEQSVAEKPAEPVAPVQEEKAPAPAEQPRTRSEAPKKLEIDEDGVPVAWILQVASVSSADKAEQLRQRLLAVDQKAYVKRVKRGDRELFRVYIGPKFERAALESIRPRIDDEFGVTSMIARYVP